MISDVIDKLDLNGKNLAGFATSGGSDYSRSQSYLQRAVEQNPKTLICWKEPF